jgi:kynureninase
MIKNKFALPKKSLYLSGHSLGPMPKSALNKVKSALKCWGKFGVKAWNEDKWINLPKIVGAKLAMQIGAKPDEVIVSDSTSVNLYKALKAALHIQSDRKIILTTEDNFPAGLYIAEGVAGFSNEIKVKAISVLDLEKSIDTDIAVLMLSHVNYRDASVLDMEKLTYAAHQKGILVIWDLSHSIGILPIQLNQTQADFAVGCTYKYLNGGPGSPAFIYVNAQHHIKVKSPIYGWMGHQNPFLFSPQYQAINNINKFMGGTPSILSLQGLEGALEIYETIDLNQLQALIKKNALYLITALKVLELDVITPEKSDVYGGHVAFIHPVGYALSRAMSAHNLIVDYRQPDLIRICINPLYISIDDLKKCIKSLQFILEKKLYQNSIYHDKQQVT